MTFRCGKANSDYRDGRGPASSVLSSSRGEFIGYQRVGLCKVTK
jgi:hypothetical protein